MGMRLKTKDVPRAPESRKNLEGKRPQHNEWIGPVVIVLMGLVLFVFMVCLANLGQG